MTTHNADKTNDLVYLTLTEHPHGVGKFIVVNDAEERSVYVDMSTSPPTVFGPENKIALENATEVTS